jgi:predicted TIM-barrel fold metal-dependent hydrolase
MFVDFHSHIFPRGKAASILEELSGRGDIPHYSDGTLDGLLDTMTRSGIGLSLISRITTQANKVAAVNQWLLRCRRPNVLPMATIHPDGPVTVEDLETFKTQGFQGIKLHPDYQGFFVDDPRMYPFYEAAQHVQMPVLFHAGLDRGLPPPVRAMPRRLLKVHRQFPRMVMVAAHMGGEDNYQETEIFLLGEDIYLDTSFVLRIMAPETLKRFFRKHPVERILFGSDSPFTDQAAELDYLLSLSFLTAAEKEKVAGGNAAALLKLSVLAGG